MDGVGDLPEWQSVERGFDIYWANSPDSLVLTNAREFVQGDRDREIGIDRMQYVHTAKLGLPSHAHLMAVLSKTNRNSGVSLNRCSLHSPNVVGLLGLLYLLLLLTLLVAQGPLRGCVKPLTAVALNFQLEK